MTKQEKLELFNNHTGQDVINNSVFWSDPEEKTYLRGLWFYCELLYHDAKIIDMTEILPDLNPVNNNKFIYTGGAANMLKRLSKHKNFRIEVLETIVRIKGGTYDK